MLASCGKGSVKLWEIETGKLRMHMIVDSWVRCVAFSPDGKLLVSADETGAITMWDMPAGKQRAVLNGHKQFVLSMAFSPNGKSLATFSNDDTIKIWEMPSSKLLRTINGAHSGVGGALAFSTDGKTLASGAGGSITLWDPGTGTEKITLKQPGYLWSLAFSPDGKLLASGGGSGEAECRLWDVAKFKHWAKLDGHGLGVKSVAFSPDGKLMASGSSDKTVKLWLVATTTELVSLKFENPINKVVFSAGGKLLAVADRGELGVVTLWDMRAMAK